MAIIPSDKKVFMVSTGTNTTYGGSAALQAMNQWYTMQDVTNTVRPYQVFTALLTQSGGDGPDNIVSGNTVIGVTYQIDGSITGDDFRNIGGPLITYMGEFQGYAFVATGTTPTVWTNGTSLNFNTGAPVVTVLENTIGNIWFTYNGTGIYNVNSSGLFVDKTFMELFNVTSAINNSSGSPFIGLGLLENSNLLIIQSVSLTDGDMYNTPIEIRVYN